MNEVAVPQSLRASASLAPVAIELQDQLHRAGIGLERLQRLLDDAATALRSAVDEADASLPRPHGGPASASLPPRPEPTRRALAALGQATRALQFHTLSTPLLADTRRRVAQCADRIAGLAAADEAGGCADADADADAQPNVQPRAAPRA